MSWSTRWLSPVRRAWHASMRLLERSMPQPSRPSRRGHASTHTVAPAPVSAPATTLSLSRLESRLLGFSFGRLLAIVRKEIIQLRRDRLTFGMMLGVPLLQMVLFGYAINADPKHLITAVLDFDASPVSRSLLASMQASGYFAQSTNYHSEQAAHEALQRGEVQFVINIPAGFSHALWRGETPALLLEADATDPAAASNAVAALRLISNNVIQRDLRAGLARLAASPAPFELRVHARYNPEGSTQYNIVPGLTGLVLTMTLVMMTSLAITRERERGTMENLLAMPTRPLEVLVGKLLPFIGIGYLQIGLILLVARWLFGVPMQGSLALLFLLALVFIAANLAVGLTVSTLAANQLQSVQASVFFFLPSVLMSGFMFPFQGMPFWARAFGECLPLTHFLRVVRGILLKGDGFAEVGGELWPIATFAVVMLTIGVLRYRQTLD